MNLSRIFANAFARRLAYVAVALLLAWMGVGSVRAEVFPPTACPNSGSTMCDQGQAYADAIRMANTMCPSNGMITCEKGAHPNCGQGPRASLSGKSYIGSVTCTDDRYRAFPNYSAGQAWFQNTCAQRASQTHQGPPIPTSGSGTTFQPGSIDCHNGCARTSLPNEDGTWTSSYSAGTVCTVEQLAKDCSAMGYITTFYGCQPPPPKCSANQTKNPVTGKCDDACPKGMHADAQGACVKDENECPAGNVRSPEGACLPGDGQCAAGEARRENGTCGKDSDGDGKADDDDDDDSNDSKKDSFSGGDNCNSPPVCNGNPILCGQARIQWRIECNTRSNVNIAGGTCGAQPTCTGEKCNAMEYSQLIMQWRTACALEKGSSGGAPGGTDDTAQYLANQRKADVTDANDLAGHGDGHDGVTEDSIWEKYAPGDFNPSMFGGGSPGQCSFTTSLELMGHPIELPAEFWVLAGMIGWLTVAGAYIWLAVTLGK